MNINELYLNINTPGFDTLVCQTEIKTLDDIKKYNNKGYLIQDTLEEFKKKYTIDPECVWYGSGIGLQCIYFNRKTFATLNIQYISFADISADFIKQMYYEIERAEKEVANNNYWLSFLSLNDKMKLELLEMLVKERADKIPDLYSLWYSIYTSTDYGFNDIDKAIIDRILQSKTDEEKAETNNALSNLPDEITVYRGGNSESTDYRDAYSWSLNPNVANFFAIRRGNGPAYIAKGTVSKKDIIEYLADTDCEDEIIIYPDKIKDIEYNELPGMEFIKDLMPFVVNDYKKYRDILVNEVSSYGNDNDVHGKEHSARVLLLCLLLAEYLGLPASDKRILGTAAIYHDSMRENDYNDSLHGKRAGEYYASVSKKIDPIVQFLCEYHCLPDEEGYAEIKRNRKLSKRRDHTILLYQIFKDADGLDRVRLGNIKNEMDLAQYRLPITKDLTFVAKLICDNIKL